MDSKTEVANPDTSKTDNNLSRVRAARLSRATLVVTFSPGAGFELDWRGVAER
jgi:hypothetical protein